MKTSIVISTILDSHRNHISTDSREIQPGCLFVALQGTQWDGHDFIESAVNQGATGILCKKEYTSDLIPFLQEKAVFYFVDDPLESYREISALWRKQFSIPIIAVAGSVGKTTTKEFLSALLSGKYENIHKTRASENGWIGIPKTLLGLEPHHQIAVIEIGIDEPGSMKKHLSLVNPTGAIVTSIGPEHLEKLKDLQTVIEEETLVLRFARESGGFSAFNQDDPFLEQWGKEHPSTSPLSWSYTLGESKGDVTATTFRNSKTLGGCLLGDELFFGEKERVKMPLPGKHNASNLLGAITIAKVLGLRLDELEEGLKTFQGCEGRSQVKTLDHLQTTVICDYYNAQPVSMKAALELLSEISKQREEKEGVPIQKTVYLGDMLELGCLEESFHRELATYLLQQNVQNIFLVGRRMFFLWDELKRRSFKGEILRHFSDVQELCKDLPRGLGEKTPQVLLIKGSRGMKMEQVWNQLDPFKHRS